MSETIPPAAGPGEAKGSTPCDSFGTFSSWSGTVISTSYAKPWRPTPVVAEAPAPVLAEAPAPVVAEAPDAPAPAVDAPDAPAQAVAEAPAADAPDAPAPAVVDASAIEAARAALAEARRAILAATAETPQAPIDGAPAQAPPAPVAVRVSPARLDDVGVAPIVEVSSQPLAEATPTAQPPLPTPTLVPNPATTRPSSRIRTLSRPTPMKSGVIARPAAQGTSSGMGPVQKDAAAKPRPSGAGPAVGGARASGAGLVQSGTRRLSSSGVWPADDGWPAELERPAAATAAPSAERADDLPRLRRPRRVRRWLTSTALLCVAFTAVTSLVEGELERDLGRKARAPNHVPVPVVADAGPRAPRAPAAPAPSSAPQRPGARAPAQPTIPPPGPARHDAPVARTVAAPQSDFVAMPGPRTSLAGGALSDLARLRTLGARLAAVDKLAAGDPAQAAETLAPLLDGELPGVDGYEVEQLRLKIMSAVGRLSGPVADRALLARLDPQRPRTERLLALSLLTKRSEALSLGRVDLERMAQGDADVVVKRAATRALAALNTVSGGVR